MAEGLPRVGSMFGRYRLDRLIGRGGMGEVYEAYDTVKDRTVALKVLTERFANDPVYRQRFQREAHAAARLKEAHVIPIHDYGEIDGHLYLDMRLVDGRSLGDAIAERGPMPPALAVAVVQQIGAALDAAHRDGLIHRDVKPDNILLTADDFAYLVDFGIANTISDERLTETGGAVGSFFYMAPERFEPGPVTPAADIYALACVLYECLTATRPYPASTDAELLRAHLFAPAPTPSTARPGIPPGLDAVVARGLAKDPAHRYPTAGTLAAAARDALTPGHHVAPTVVSPASRGGAASPAPPQPSVAPSAPRRRRWILPAAAALVVIALIAAGAVWLLRDKPDESASAATTVDATALDVGPYSIEPRTFSGPPTDAEGRALEAFRLAEAMADPYDVDPALDHRYELASPDPAVVATSIAGTGTPIAAPVLEQYGMISAVQVQGYSKRLQDFLRSPDGEALIVAVMSFPNADAATRAAAEIDDVDFAANSANEHASIPGYPDAKAHFRPGNPSIAATMARGRLVVSVLTASSATPDIDDLADRIARTLDLQVPLMDAVVPVLAVSVTGLPRDPDRMLARAFSTDPETPISATYGTIGPLAATFCASSQSHKDGRFEQSGVDRCTFTPDSQVLRARDAAAAAELVTGLLESDADEYIDRDVASPDGLPDARCYEQKQEIWADNANSRFVCLVSYDRYVGAVWSSDDNDVRLRAAAQYSILAAVTH